jgi:hypothetical protein
MLPNEARAGSGCLKGGAEREIRELASWAAEAACGLLGLGGGGWGSGGVRSGASTVERANRA